MERTPIYLDYNATSPLHPKAREAMLEWMDGAHNPSSVHGAGRKARAEIETVRAQLAEMIGTFANEIIFTASATEANNWVMRHFGNRPIIISAVEHPSIYNATAAGAKLAPVDSDGVIILPKLEALLRETPNAFVSIMLANNETGTIQPVREAAMLARQYGAVLHCDAVQALGKIHLDFTALGADMMTLSGHKCGGPLGVGALIIRQGLAISPMLKGGGQELSRRAGTENVAAIAGFGAALQQFDYKHMCHLHNWLRKMEITLTKLSPSIEIAGKGAERLPNTSCLTMPGLKGETQVMRFDLDGFAVSSGSACTSGRTEPSPVMSAMGLKLPDNALRISGGWKTTEAEIEAFTASWEACFSRANAKAAA